MPYTQPYKIAYIMKGFPRASEPFIANEIFILEQLGLTIQIFAIQSLSEEKFHSIVDKIKAPVTYLPEDPSAADADISAWFKANLPRFLNDHMHVLARRPLAYISTFLQMIHYSFKYREGFFKKIKKVFFKDFLRAGYIACQVLRSGQFAHLHGHFCHGSTTITMFVSRLTGIPFSFTAHAKDIYLPKLNPKDLLKVKIRKAEFVATCTDANRVHLQKICPEAANIQTIYHGLDTSLFRPIDQPGDNHKIPLILAVGRCVAKKGVPLSGSSMRNSSRKRIHI